MAKKNTTKSKKQNSKKKFFDNKNILLTIGVLLILISVSLLLSFTSFIFNWSADQSQLEFLDKNIQVQNIFGKTGASIGNLFIHKWFGVASYVFVYLIFMLGLIISLKLNSKKFLNNLYKNIIFVFWLSIAFSYLLDFIPILGGVFGYEIKLLLSSYIGGTGLGILLFFTFSIWVIFRFNLTPQLINNKLFATKNAISNLKSKSIKGDVDTGINDESDEPDDDFDIVNVKDPETNNDKSDGLEINGLDAFDEIPPCPIKEVENKVEENVNDGTDTLVIAEVKEEEQVDDSSDGNYDGNSDDKKDLLVTADNDLSNKLVEQFGEYDPELELGHFKKPELQHLAEYDNENISIDREELEVNKNRIVETLNNYKIEISKIKATIGPTVTLYEIVPAPGVRISKIKNLEDDIALSLSALGIRIIAPIPGKGTIGIEVPNKKPTIVSMKSVLSSSVFQNSKMDLPVALGKTISNTTFVTDLAKMPHLLVAGATGQGKSVGLNAIMTSLLYKKHPSELKFVLIDPKKVELTLFNKIERHYLAKLPDSDSAIITDTHKVINTLNSLCLEMDDRYNLLKDGLVRNIKEYNRKFKKRKLNPENGHKFLPYIVLVIDEFSDLIMTAGKEVETPIARLAQLARAVGIHLIVATQRPSVNVITGTIKANFPARLAFRVTSKIDSRTILDEGGANQLIGKGDMLFTNGNEMVRIQCAFVDTPEVEAITNYIGEQKGYADAFLLPEYESDENSGNTSIDVDDRDPKFREAASLIVMAQQGSASLLQRKLKLGYNRAGRIVDQLEDAGIIGPFEGSKARQVLIPDEVALQQRLDEN